ncbi:TIGR03773 family transporter-associated surface protein [Phytohabitans sp. ZYX-F-186]|uniref:TIGR03773 family transporter-associated surface protein n=1 Tax=Phytohabitans maris TaxID=3071409 RepID=A0ABU0ZSG0_9ACTN|nr:TIGR03773 family transporter-associated surface protein [Phytohabitans sp. ZYX-F-186]MDQ7909960.1 TIGR03773 family transporter-associated surface protein [Phytohabitans sp. ZYX-F-186]
MKRTASLLAAVALAITAAPAAAHAEPRTLPVAGADLVSIRLDGDALSLRVRDAAQARRGEAGHDPAEVALGPDGGAAGAIPGRAGFEFLGKAGTPLWVLAGAGGGFPFWDTTAIPRGKLAGDAVTLRLSDVEGPGRFHAYTVSSFGAPTPLLGSGDGGPRAMTLPVGARTGAALWAFDTPGSYRVTLEAAAGPLTTEATYQIEVPQISPEPAPALAAPARPVPQAPATSVPSERLEAPKVPAVPKIAAQAAAAPATGRKVIADGHIDMGPQLDGSTWRIRIRDDSGSPPVWRELSDVVVHAVDKAKIKVPSGSDYAFLGPAGSDVWLLPQAQQSGIVWPGWNTQDPSVVNGTQGNVTWRLTDVDGPGEFKLFLTGSFGKPDVLFDTAKSLPQQMSIPPNTHAHGNWAFTKPGVYHLGVQMTGTTKAGATVTDSRTLNIAVGPVDPNTAFPSGGGSNGNGSNGGGSNGGGSNGGNLPRTGVGWVIPAAAGGLLLLIVGAVLVVATRRRIRSA